MEKKTKLSSCFRTICDLLKKVLVSLMRDEQKDFFRMSFFWRIMDPLSLSVSPHVRRPQPLDRPEPNLERGSPRTWKAITGSTFAIASLIFCFTNLLVKMPCMAVTIGSNLESDFCSLINHQNALQLLCELAIIIVNAKMRLQAFNGS